MSFKTLALITSAILLLLGLGYLIVGSLIVSRWQIDPSDSVLLFGRRIGSLYIGLSVIYFFARSSPVSATRTALITGTAVALLLLVSLGIYELSAGHVGKGILVSMSIEFILLLLYVRLLLIERTLKIASLNK